MHRDLTLHVKGSACKCIGKVAKIHSKKTKIGLHLEELNLDIPA